MHGRPHFDDEPRSLWLQRVATAFLAALAVLFGGHAVWPARVGSYVARAVVEYQPAPGAKPEPMDLPACRAEISSDEFLWAATGDLGLTTPPAAWRTNLSVYRQFDAAHPHAQRLAIELSSQHEHEAQVVVDRLARQFVLDREPQPALAPVPSAELAAAEKQLAEARAVEEAARRVFDALTRDYFDELARQPLSPTDDAPEPAVEQSPKQAATSREQSAWLRLRERVKSLEERHAELLGRMTSKHPLVQDLEMELADARQRLEELSAARESSPGQASFPREVSESIGIQDQSRYQATRESYEAARSKRLEAEAAVEVLQESPAASPADGRLWVAESGHIVHRELAVSPLVRWAVLMTFSSLAGLATWRVLAPSGQRHAVLKSAEEVATALDLPVVANMPKFG